MKTRSLFLIFALAAVPLLIPTSTMAADKTEESAEADEKDGKRNTTILVLTATAEKVHAAALEALAAVGCKVKSDSPTYIEGKRSNKVGIAVGSGGEKLFVWIKDVGEGKTELKVTTKKTLVGIVGQKLWNEQVANQVRDAVK
jgi:hypothetical protein